MIYIFLLIIGLGLFALCEVRSLQIGVGVALFSKTYIRLANMAYKHIVVYKKANTEEFWGDWSDEWISREEELRLRLVDNELREKHIKFFRFHKTRIYRFKKKNEYLVFLLTSY